MAPWFLLRCLNMCMQSSSIDRQTGIGMCTGTCVCVCVRTCVHMTLHTWILEVKSLSCCALGAGICAHSLSICALSHSCCPLSLRERERANRERVRGICAHSLSICALCAALSLSPSTYMFVVLYVCYPMYTRIYTHRFATAPSFPGLARFL